MRSDSHVSAGPLAHRYPTRRDFLRAALGGSALGLLGLGLTGCGGGGTPDADKGDGASPDTGPFAIEEATLTALQAAMTRGTLTSRALCEHYLARIQTIDRAGPTLRSVLETNPDALAIADALDDERRTRGMRGPLHGIPVLIKGNCATFDSMGTTAGSLALVGARAPEDSAVARKLRAAGTVILGKTNLSEWANFRGAPSSNGWSAQGGQCLNPYALDRTPSGSSSGTAAAIAANLAAVGVGTETDGSIVSPSSACGLVGIKPTVGLISRRGIVPISHTQDTPGPMARTVRDAATLLGALAGIDPKDPATEGAMTLPDYTVGLDESGLKGAKLASLGVLGMSAEADRVLAHFLLTVQSLGATTFNTSIPNSDEFSAYEHTVLLYEFPADLAAYLAVFGQGAPVRSLADVIAFNNQHRDLEMPFFGQELMVESEVRGPLTDQTYLDALARSGRYARTLGLDAAFDQFGVDAFVTVTTNAACKIDHHWGDSGLVGSAGFAAVSGYPSITVPAGFAAELPIGISFIGRKWSEAKLIQLAYAYEQATKHRRPPRFSPTSTYSEC